MTPRVTQADIARRAGVHRATVSLCLRNSPSIPEATRIHIQTLAKEMGYQPDPVLQALMSYRSSHLSNRRAITLAYVTNWDSKWGWRAAPAHRSFFDGASRRSNELGYGLDHFWLKEPELSHQRTSDILFNRGIDGVILASHLQSGTDSLDFDWPKFSAVKIDCFPRVPALHSITNDQCKIIQLTMRQVVTAGYGRIGFAMPHNWDELADFAWSAGFLAEQARLPKADHVPIYYLPEQTDPRPVSTNPNARVSPESFKQWLSRHRPEVIVSHANYIMPHISRLGLKIPSDVAYVDIFVESPDGRIAGVLQSSERVGEIAVEVLAGQLLQNIRGIPTVPTATLVEGTWIDGATLPRRGQTPAQRT